MSRTPQGQRAGLDKQPHEVAAMFDGVASRYDLTNTVLSFGQDRHWRRATQAALELGPGDRVLQFASPGFDASINRSTVDPVGMMTVSFHTRFFVRTPSRAITSIR